MGVIELFNGHLERPQHRWTPAWWAVVLLGFVTSVGLLLLVIFASRRYYSRQSSSRLLENQEPPDEEVAQLPVYWAKPWARAVDDNGFVTGDDDDEDEDILFGSPPPPVLVDYLVN